jgi:transposase-like protein
MGKRQSTGFKLKVVERALTRTSNETLAQIAQEFGLGYSTLTRWMSHVQQGTLAEQANTTAKEKSPKEWTAQAKWQALVAYEGLDEQARGQYCRTQGIYSHQLDEWRATMMSKQDAEQRQQDKAEIRSLKGENKRLQRELARKEKALAEAAALMILKKKAAALFGEDEDN